MKLVLLFTTIVLLTTAVAQETHPDCEYHGQTYKFQESWPNNCARCTCLQASTVICGPDICSTCKYGSPTMYYPHKGFFLDGCKTCECYDGIVSCTDETELCEKVQAAKENAARIAKELEEISDADLSL